MWLADFAMEYVCNKSSDKENDDDNIQPTKMPITRKSY